MNRLRQVVKIEFDVIVKRDDMHREDRMDIVAGVADNPGPGFALNHLEQPLAGCSSVL